jgi:hypothetical protein
MSAGTWVEVVPASLFPLWCAIALVIAVGVSQAAGTRWFRERGGMPLFMVTPLTGRYLSFPEREEIATLKAQGVGVREIGRRLGCVTRRPFLESSAAQDGEAGHQRSIA